MTLFRDNAIINNNATMNNGCKTSSTTLHHIATFQQQHHYMTIMMTTKDDATIINKHEKCCLYRKQQTQHNPIKPLPTKHHSHDVNNPLMMTSHQMMTLHFEPELHDNTSPQIFTIHR
jgi:hypothetical protein